MIEAHQPKWHGRRALKIMRKMRVHDLILGGKARW
jgi:hypothetical protein